MKSSSRYCASDDFEAAVDTKGGQQGAERDLEAEKVGREASPLEGKAGLRHLRRVAGCGSVRGWYPITREGLEGLLVDLIFPGFWILCVKIL